MIKVEVTIQNDKTVITYLRKIRKTIPLNAGKVMRRYGNFVKRSAKVRASAQRRWASSGKLSKSIKVTYPKKNEMKVIAYSQSAPFQEVGYLAHYVSMEHLSERALRSMKNYQIGMSHKGTGQGKRGMIFVKDSKPYMEPAFRKANTKLEGWINVAMDDALR